MNHTTAAKPRLLVLTSSFPRWAHDEAVGGGDFVARLAVAATADYEVFLLAPLAVGAAPQETIQGVHVYRHRQTPWPSVELAYGSGLLSNIKRKPWLAWCVPWYVG